MWCCVCLGGDRQAELVESQSYANCLVAHGAERRTQLVAVAQTGAFEQPVVVPVHGEAAAGAGSCLPEPAVQAVGGAGAEETPLRPTYYRVAPHAGHLALAVGAQDWVGAVGVVLVGRHGASFVGEPHLPEHSVARQAGVIAAICDMPFDCVALRRRPVLVVAHAQHQSVSVDD